MRIASSVATTISKVPIFTGVGEYKLDHNEPKTAFQLRVLRDDQKVIAFNEVLPELDLSDGTPRLTEEAKKRVEDRAKKSAEASAAKVKFERKKKVEDCVF